MLQEAERRIVGHNRRSFATDQTTGIAKCRRWPTTLGIATMLDGPERQVPGRENRTAATRMHRSGGSCRPFSDAQSPNLGPQRQTVCYSAVDDQPLRSQVLRRGADAECRSPAYRRSIDLRETDGKRL